MRDSSGEDRLRTTVRSSTVSLVLVLLLPVAVALYAGVTTGRSGVIAWPLALVALAIACTAGAVRLWQAATPRVGPPPAAEAETGAVTGRGGPAPADAAPAPSSPASDGASPMPPETAETAALLSTFSRVLAGVERQASDIERFADRLDLAYRDIQTSSARLKEFSFKDEVTGLYNRRFFSIRLEEEVSRYRRFNHPVSVVLLDLDAFKAVNDELGHGAGDETLRGVAEVLMKNSRGINVICRYGGDEFAVLLVETSKTGARLYADRIRYVLPGYRFAHGRRITASFGIASVPEDVAPQADELIRAADEALYAAKRAGKNRVSVYE